MAVSTYLVLWSPSLFVTATWFPGDFVTGGRYAQRGRSDWLRGLRKTGEECPNLALCLTPQRRFYGPWLVVVLRGWNNFYSDAGNCRGTLSCIFSLHSLSFRPDEKGSLSPAPPEGQLWHSTQTNLSSKGDLYSHCRGSFCLLLNFWEWLALKCNWELVWLHSNQITIIKCLLTLIFFFPLL